MAFPFKSNLFKNPPNAALERCATKPDGHVSIKDNKTGPHVHRIQEALLRIGASDPDLRDKISITASEINSQTFGETTRKSVAAYKIKRNIVNTSYQSTPDDIVGVMTIQFTGKSSRPRPGGGSGSCKSGSLGGRPVFTLNPFRAGRSPT